MKVRNKKLGVGFAWAVAGVLAADPALASTDDPMDPLYGTVSGQGKRIATVTSDEPTAPTIREAGVVAVSMKSGLSDMLFSAPFDQSVGTKPSAIAVGDFDGDGRNDIAVSNKSTNDVSVLLASGPGTFLPARNFTAGDQPRSLAAGDLDGDGFDDLVVANRMSVDLSVLLADGSGGFEPAFTVGVAEQPGAMTLADLDGDGDLDVVVTFPEADRVAVLAGNGDGRLASNVLYVTGRAPVAVATADFDGDGVLDVATANRLSDDVTVLPGVGDGTLDTGRNFAAGAGPFHLAADDLNGDGALELVVADYDSNGLAVLRGDGAGSFAAPTLAATDAGPAWVATGDFNADSFKDVAVVNFGSGNLMVFAGDGTGTVAMATLLGSGVGPRALAAMDLDGDQRIDLVAAIRDDDVVAWYLNEGPFPQAVPPTAVAGADQVHECSSEAGASVRLDGTASTADRGDVVSYEWIAGGETLAEGALVDVELPLGITTVTLRVTDEAGETATDTLDVVVEDTTAPSVSVNPDPLVLTPADHRMVPVHVTVDTTDACGDVETVLLSVVSSQPDDAPGASDGDTQMDVQGAVVGTADFDMELRAENDVTDPSGRTYTITYRVTDAAGNSSEESRNVVVPYDESNDPGDDPVGDDEGDPADDDEDDPNDDPHGDDDDDDDRGDDDDDDWGDDDDDDDRGDDDDDDDRGDDDDDDDDDDD